MTDERLRSINTAIANDYDSCVYEAGVNPFRRIPRICGQAAVFGAVRKPVDVLDIGCGTGVQLLQAAPDVAGRLVGIDISPVACELARQKLDDFRDRTTILCRDFLDLDPDELGKFDVIYVIGVIYVVPPEVRRKVMEIIDRCLRPGGVVQISYYAGSYPAVRANLYSALRSGTGDAPARDDAIRIARENLDGLFQATAQLDSGDPRRMAVLETQAMNDVNFFHEVFNSSFTAEITGRLEQDLSGIGLSFAGYFPPQSVDESLDSPQLAKLCDTHDFKHGGGYHHAAFAKYDGVAPATLTQWPVVWESRLKRDVRGEFRGEQQFGVPGTNMMVNISDPATIAAFDALMDGPLAWDELAARITIALSVAGLACDPERLVTLQGNLRAMVKLDLVVPLYSEGSAVPATPVVKPAMLTPQSSRDGFGSIPLKALVGFHVALDWASVSTQALVA